MVCRPEKMLVPTSAFTCQKMDLYTSALILLQRVETTDLAEQASSYPSLLLSLPTYRQPSILG